MPLKIELKRGERIILGEYDITSTERTRLVFHNDKVTILREKDILAPEQANTPAKRLYLSVQLMYVSKNPGPQREEYTALSQSILHADASTGEYLETINRYIALNEMYKALKEAKRLIEHEERADLHRGRGAGYG